MKSKLTRGIALVLLLFLLLSGGISASADSSSNTVQEAQRLLDGIVDMQCQKSGGSTVQQWIDGSLTQNAGASSEWYILALSQSGAYDFSAYQAALLRYLEENPVYAAASRQKYALALIATGSTDSYIRSTLNDSIGQQGVMSWIYGLHLLNNGYTSDAYSAASVREKLLSLQLADGGWAVLGTSGDVDVTAMAVQALAPYYGTDSAVTGAVEQALQLLSDRQQTAGDYASYGVSNPESTAQVLVALSALGIPCESDARFLKNGNTLLDGLEQYRLPDGSFCHKLGAASNETATVQVCYGLVAYLRMAKGQGPLYLLDRRNPDGLLTGDSAASSAVSETVDSSRDPVSSQGGVSDPAGDASEPLSAERVDAPSQDIAAASLMAGSVPEDASDGADVSAPSGVEGAADSAQDSELSQQRSYRLWICLAIVLAGVVGCLILYLAKKRKPHHFLTVLAAVALAVVLVCSVQLQSVEEYYSCQRAATEDAVGTVTLTIRCDTVVHKSDASYIPRDGVILPVTSFSIDADDTVFDILSEAVRANRIPMESTGSGAGVYIEGIQNLYEFDFGDLSGWMYYVNGSSPSVGCGNYQLSDGDEIQWLYTCDLGNDLG